jgi:hypothetical protein
MTRRATPCETVRQWTCQTRSRRPQADQLRMLDGARRSAQNPDLLVAYLKSVAVRAMQDVMAQRSRTPGTSGSSSRKPVSTSTRRVVSCRPFASRTWNPGLVPRKTSMTVPSMRRRGNPSPLMGGQEVVRRKAVAREEAMHVGGGRVPWRPAIYHGDLAPGPGQDQPLRPPGRANAHPCKVRQVTHWLTDILESHSARRLQWTCAAPVPVGSLGSVDSRTYRLSSPSPRNVVR